MKNLLFMGLILLGMGQLSAQEITFESEVMDYGTIEKAANGIRKFQFKNTGDAPLIITHAQKSCGCTVPQWPKEPIMPGSSGVIEVKYDTKRVGAFTKYVTVTSNAKNKTSVRLKIHGKVQPELAPTPVKEENIFSQ